MRQNYLSPKSPKDSYDSSSPVLVAKEVSEEQRQQLKTKADMLLEQGDLDETQSVYDEALTAYNDALEIYSTLEDAQGIIKVYLRFASIHYHVGKIELSRKVCSDALALAEANRLPNLKADVLVQLGELDRKTYDYQNALERFQQSLQIAVERKDTFRQETFLGA